MNGEDIIRMAVKCQLINAGNRDGLYMDALAEFAELVAATEREACAVMINILQKSGIGEEHLVEAIRARGQI